jgi:hypothetical protein
MLFGIVIGELIAFTLFFTTLGRPVREAGSIVADLVTCISAPVMISVALAWLPEPTWRSRGALLLIGLSAVAGQLYVELHRNAKFRAVFAEMPIIGRRLQSLFTRRVCAD